MDFLEGACRSFLAGEGEETGEGEGGGGGGRPFGGRPMAVLRATFEVPFTWFCKKPKPKNCGRRFFVKICVKNIAGWCALFLMIRVV